MPGPASPWGYCLRVQVGDLNRDFLESGPQPLGLDATKKKVVNQNICKSVSYLLYCQAAVRLAGITIPEKQTEKDFPTGIVGSGRDLAACCGLGQVGIGSGMDFLFACEGEVKHCKHSLSPLSAFQEGHLLNIGKN